MVALEEQQQTHRLEASVVMPEEQQPTHRSEASVVSSGGDGEQLRHAGLTNGVDVASPGWMVEWLSGWVVG